MSGDRRGGGGRAGGVTAAAPKARLRGSLCTTAARRECPLTRPTTLGGATWLPSIRTVRGR
eukprot:1592595-Prymnesium_polylepis.1